MTIYLAAAVAAAFRQYFCCWLQVNLTMMSTEHVILQYKMISMQVFQHSHEARHAQYSTPMPSYTIGQLQFVVGHWLASMLKGMLEVSKDVRGHKQSNSKC